MICHRHLIAVLVILFATPLLAMGQQEDEAATEPTTPATKPATEEPRITDPAVLAILESKPKTPADQLNAVLLLVELGQPELARPMLKQLIDAKPDDATLAALGEKFGTAAFLELGRVKTLAPESVEFANAVVSAAAKISRDPARLETLVKQLSDANEANHQDAIIGLLRGGSASVGPLFAALADGQRENEHAEIRKTIVRLNDDAIGPLSSILEVPDVKEQVLAISLLGQLRAEKEIPALVAIYANPSSDPSVKQAAGKAIEMISGQAPTRSELPRFLEQMTKRELERAELIDSHDTYGIDPSTVEIWRWNADERRPVMSLEPAANVARSNAARTARALAAIDPKSESRRNLCLTAFLEDAKHRGGLDHPLSPAVAEQVAAFGVAAVNDLLADAIASDHTATAIGAVEVLGKFGSPAVLEHSDGRRSPLAEAARNSDRRVRFAAIEAILKLRPATPFPGASSVAEGLKFFASTSGVRRALVAHPKSGIAQQLAGYLSTLGYEVDIATNGRLAFNFAINSPDYEVAIIHAAIDRPRVDDLLGQLRKDPRTARLPVALIAVPEDPTRTERLARGVPLCHTFAEPQDAAALKSQVERLLSMPGCQPVPFDVRTHHAGWAIAAIAQLGEQPVSWLDVRTFSRSAEHALYAPATMRAAASVLANAGTASGQSELVQLAARISLPVATRELAALAFARSVAKHGILLTSDQIQEQYDRYNINAGRNRDTHKVMLIILEAMEAKTDVANRAPEE